MTKRLTKPQRSRVAPAKKRATREYRATAKPRPRGKLSPAVDAFAGLPPQELPPDVQERMNIDAPPASKPAAAKKDRPSARCSIVAPAFMSATTGAIRRRLKGQAATAVIVLVPSSSWIEPTIKLFLERFGRRWQAVEAGAATMAARLKSDTLVSLDLSEGKCVVGVAAHRDALPSVLATGADLTIRIAAPDRATIGRAIRMFTGQRASLIDEFGLEFHDLVAAFRRDSSPAEIVGRLREAAAALRGAAPTERLPALDTAVEYGAARTWGMTLARDIADYRAGRLDWQQVDRGAIFYSEPGLGKTLLARILAQACGVPLLTFSIADLFASSPGYLDSVIKASRAMFDRAAALSPCILFIDEIDALPNRATLSDRAAEWWTSVVTDFLLSLDNAVAGHRAGIVVIGATNAIGGVDAALLRPGRLERAIEIIRPDQAGAVNILRHHLNGEVADADLTEIGHLLAGSTGAQIMMAVRGARRIARYARRELTLADLFQSIAPVEDIAPDALNRICIHEAAHAIGSLAVRSGILLRCVVGGAASSAGRTVIQMDKGDLLTRDSVERRVVVTLCGRAAEELLIGNISLGSGGDDDSDLAQVTKWIAALHASTGLGGTLAYLISHHDTLTAVRADFKLRARVERHLQTLHERAGEIVRLHRDAIVAVADQLRVRRHLSGEEIRRIVATTNLSTSQSQTTEP